MNLIFLTAIVLAPLPSTPATYGLDPMPAPVIEEFRSPSYGLVASAPAIPPAIADEFDAIMQETVKEPVSPIQTTEPALTDQVPTPSEPIPTMMVPTVVCDNGVCQRVMRYVARPVRARLSRPSWISDVPGGMDTAYGMDAAYPVRFYSQPVTWLTPKPAGWYHVASPVGCVGTTTGGCVGTTTGVYQNQFQYRRQAFQQRPGVFAWRWSAAQW